MVRGISIEAYYKHRESGKAMSQWAAIYDYLVLRLPLTRSEISARTGIRLSSVCGRVNELIKAGLLEESPRRDCRITNEPAHPVGTKMQGELF